MSDSSFSSGGDENKKWNWEWNLASEVTFNKKKRGKTDEKRDENLIKGGRGGTVQETWN